MVAVYTVALADVVVARSAAPLCALARVWQTAVLTFPWICVTTPVSLSAHEKHVPGTKFIVPRGVPTGVPLSCTMSVPLRRLR